MNIYTEIEVSKRELSGRLLVSMELALMGHNAFVASREIINNLAINKLIPPGVIYLKDINPAAYRIKDYKKIIKNGFKLVSQDEEIGVFNSNSYTKFYNERFKSKQSFKYFDKFFCWGNLDYNFLKNKKYKTKFIKTGSPRIDIDFKTPNKIKNKKRILISLNHSIFWKRDLIDRIIIENEDVNRNDLIKSQFLVYDIESKETLVFYYLAELIDKIIKLKKFEITIRSHPAMDPKKVDAFFKQFKNIKINHKGDLVDQISQTDFLIHNGCTSAVTATIKNKNIITYIPKNGVIYDYLNNNHLNRLGKKFYNSDSIIKYLKKKYFHEKKIINNNINIVKQRTLIDGFSYKRIAKEIDKINFKKQIKKFKMKHFFHIYKFHYLKLTTFFLKKILSSNQKSGFELKFPAFNYYEINNTIDKLNKNFHTNKKFSIKIYGDRLLRISKKI